MTQNEYWCWSATVATIYVFIDDSCHLHCIEIGCRLTVSTEHLVIIKQCVAPFFFTLKNVLLKEKIGAVECCCIFFCFFSLFFFFAFITEALPKNQFPEYHYLNIIVYKNLYQSYIC